VHWFGALERQGGGVDGECFFEFGEACFDGGVADAEGGFHIADAAFAVDEDAEEVEVVLFEGGEFVGGEVAGDGQVAGGAVEGGGGERALARGAADVGGGAHGGNLTPFMDDASRKLRILIFKLTFISLWGIWRNSDAICEARNRLDK